MLMHRHARHFRCRVCLGRRGRVTVPVYRLRAELLYYQSTVHTNREKVNHGGALLLIHSVH